MGEAGENVLVDRWALNHYLAILSQIDGQTAVATRILVFVKHFELHGASPMKSRIDFKLSRFNFQVNPNLHYSALRPHQDHQMKKPYLTFDFGRQ